MVKLRSIAKLGDAALMELVMERSSGDRKSYKVRPPISPWQAWKERDSTGNNAFSRVLIVYCSMVESLIIDSTTLDLSGYLHYHNSHVINSMAAIVWPDYNNSA